VKAIRLWTRGLRITLGGFALVLMLVAAGVWATAAEPEESAQGEVTVTALNFAFEPSTVVVKAGEKIRFQVKNPSSGYHTFTVYRSSKDRENALVDADVPPRQDQVIELEMPDEEITLYLVCLPHESLGMVGSIVVKANP